MLIAAPPCDSDRIRDLGARSEHTPDQPDGAYIWLSLRGHHHGSLELGFIQFTRRGRIWKPKMGHCTHTQR